MLCVCVGDVIDVVFSVVFSVCIYIYMFISYSHGILLYYDKHYYTYTQ